MIWCFVIVFIFMALVCIFGMVFDPLEKRRQRELSKHKDTSRVCSDINDR
jgi:low temperature requirement protein LtrA